MVSLNDHYEYDYLEQCTITPQEHQDTFSRWCHIHRIPTINIQMITHNYMNTVF